MTARTTLLAPPVMAFPPTMAGSRKVDAGVGCEVAPLITRAPPPRRSRVLSMVVNEKK
jgi:hypothetical protein